jgi:hypothetical protein
VTKKDVPENLIGKAVFDANHQPETHDE